MEIINNNVDTIAKVELKRNFFVKKFIIGSAIKLKRKAQII